MPRAGTAPFSIKRIFCLPSPFFINCAATKHPQKPPPMIAISHVKELISLCLFFEEPIKSHSPSIKWKIFFLIVLCYINLLGLTCLYQNLVKKLRFWQGGALNLNQAMPTLKAAQLEKVGRCRRVQSQRLSDVVKSQFSLGFGIKYGAHPF